jgi:hypothetical protein
MRRLFTREIAVNGVSLGAPFYSSPACSSPPPSQECQIPSCTAIDNTIPIPPCTLAQGPSSSLVSRTSLTSSPPSAPNSGTSAAGFDQSEFPSSLAHINAHPCDRYATAIFTAYIQNKLQKGRSRFEVSLKVQDLERGVRPSLTPSLSIP